MEQVNKTRKSLLVPVWMIPIFIVAVGCVFLGYKLGGTTSSLYVLGFIVALMIGFLGGLISFVFEIKALIHGIKAGKELPKKYYLFWALEVAVTIFWIVGAFRTFAASMGV